MTTTPALSLESAQAILNQSECKFYDLTILGRHPDSMNQVRRRFWAWNKQEKKAWTDAIIALAKSEKIPPLPFAFIQLRLFFKDFRRRDADNYSPKILTDGIVYAGILKDDTPLYVQWVPTLIVPGSARPRTVLRLYTTSPMILHRSVYDHDE